MPKFQFLLGDHVEDLITGLKGVVISRIDSLTGCNRYTVQPGVDKDGKYVEGWIIDEHSLKISGDKARLTLERHVDQPPG